MYHRSRQDRILVALLWTFLNEVLVFTPSFNCYADRPGNLPLGVFCPPDWLQHQGSCYKRFAADKNWQQASKTCHEWEGHLVALTTEATQEFVHKNLAGNRTLWIGLSRNKEGIFLWSNGEPLEYSNWVTGEPSGSSSSEECVEMTDYGSFHGKWNDKPCSHQQQFICQKGRSGQLYVMRPHVMLFGKTTDQLRASSAIECVVHCQAFPGCKSANYSPKSGVCELNSSTMADFPEGHVTEKDFNYYEKTE